MVELKLESDMPVLCDVSPSFNNGACNMLNIMFVSEPGKVRNAVAYAWGDSWICLRWEEPYPPTGELEHYEIQIIGKESTSRIVKPQVYCSLWKEKICVRLENLETHVHHSIEVNYP